MAFNLLLIEIPEIRNAASFISLVILHYAWPKQAGQSKYLLADPA